MAPRLCSAAFTLVWNLACNLVGIEDMFGTCHRTLTHRDLEAVAGSVSAQNQKGPYTAGCDVV